MKIVCSWCKKDMGKKEPLENNQISHSICMECGKELYPDIFNSEEFKQNYEKIKEL